MAKTPKKPLWIIGIDEVGRGPLAGPVTVCAAAMPLAIYRKMNWKKGKVGLTDSKKMSAGSRETWEKKARELKATGKLKIAIASCSAAMIDARGIAPCIRSSIQSALRNLRLDASECMIVLDGGLKAPKNYLYQQTVIRGDQKHKIISLAAVIAKVRRDALMKKLHLQYPAYAWESNKGYGTRAHIKTLRRVGPSPLHRKSFITKLL